MAFITIDYLKSLGFRIPDSSVESVNEQLNKLIDNAEKEYFNNTIGYDLTTALYALSEPYPADVVVFLDGNLVDGDLFYRGVKFEISYFIMALFYGGVGISLNNSGFTTPISDGERNIEANFVVNASINTTRLQRIKTFEWLEANNIDFFVTWQEDYFKCMEATSVW